VVEEQLLRERRTSGDLENTDKQTRLLLLPTLHGSYNNQKGSLFVNLNPPLLPKPKQK
jgi:hypothetical protein